jgi:transglutaminase-like putative cysteine protease
MTVLLVRHVTRYRYRQPVSFGEHRMMLRPRESYDQRLVESRLTISPEPTAFRQVQDVFGNCVAIADFDGKAGELVFESEFRLEHNPAPLPHGAASSPYPFAYPADDLPDLTSSIERHWPDPHGEVTAWARDFARAHGADGALALLSEMTRGIRRDFKYARRLEKGLKSPIETLRDGDGACRDFALLMMEAARALGFAARFVSGYIYTPPIEGGWVGGGHTHAWVRVYLPCSGWVEFDPTNGIVGGRDLIRVAIARDPRQAVPLHGTWFGSAGDFLGMEVEVDVRIAAEREAELRVAC